MGACFFDTASTTFLVNRLVCTMSRTVSPKSIAGNDIRLHSSGEQNQWKLDRLFRFSVSSRLLNNRKKNNHVKYLCFDFDYVHCHELKIIVTFNF